MSTAIQPVLRARREGRPAELRRPHRARGHQAVRPGHAERPAARRPASSPATSSPRRSPTTRSRLANPLGTHAGFIASINPVADLRTTSASRSPAPARSWSSTRPATASAAARAASTSALTLYNAGHGIVQDRLGRRRGQLLADLARTSTPTAKNLTAGTYYVSVDMAGNNATFWQYVVNIAVYQPGCGDDYLEGNEQCDDGAANGTTGDGCDGDVPLRRALGDRAQRRARHGDVQLRRERGLDDVEGRDQAGRRHRLLRVRADGTGQRDAHHARRGQPDRTAARTRCSPCTTASPT